MNRTAAPSRPLPIRSRIDLTAMPVRLSFLLAALCAVPVLAADSAWDRAGHPGVDAGSPMQPTKSLPSRGSLATLPNLAAFQAATDGMDITSEDFSARPSGNVSPCYEPVNHQLGQPGTAFSPPVCFDPGTLKPGFSLRSNNGYLNGFGMMAFGAGTVGLSVPVVGAMQPSTVLLIDFDDAPVAVAMDAWDWQAGSPLTFTVYDLDDAVIDSFTLVPVSPQQSAFAGFISSVPVKRVTVAGAASASQMISALHFGGRGGSIEAAVPRVDFGAVTLGDESVADVELRNTGDIPHAVDTVGSLPGVEPFAIVADACSGQTLLPDASCVIEVRFAPALRQLYQPVWTVLPGQDDVAPVQLVLHGRGALPMLTSDAAQADFGLVAPGSSATATITLRSVGAVPVELQSALLTGPFLLENNGCGPLPAILPPGESCLLLIRFLASSSEPAYGYVEVVSSDPSSPVHVRLLGNVDDAIFVDGFEAP
jgi:hypothetical protein